MNRTNKGGQKWVFFSVGRGVWKKKEKELGGGCSRRV